MESGLLILRLGLGDSLLGLSHLFTPLASLVALVAGIVGASLNLALRRPAAPAPATA